MEKELKDNINALWTRLIALENKVNIPKEIKDVVARLNIDSHAKHIEKLEKELFEIAEEVPIWNKVVEQFMDKVQNSPQKPKILAQLFSLWKR